MTKWPLPRSLVGHGREKLKEGLFLFPQHKALMDFSRTQSFVNFWFISYYSWSAEQDLIFHNPHYRWEKINSSICQLFDRGKRKVSLPLFHFLFLLSRMQLRLFPSSPQKNRLEARQGGGENSIIGQFFCRRTDYHALHALLYEDGIGGSFMVFERTIS